ncbi:hypothetical protein DEO72_LG9g1811 [Vigna unguiculata]|uniref:Uncharacterized protein n=1 Tax=Vigna unguiculata TaxID=3917 RepID=A0A4D6N446_VIGUN|nr:hypothetical protein DEO72_LG9g1811 [Vigna unguiculata]
MGRVYESSFQAKFMDQVYEPSLLVLFSGLVYRSSFWFDFTNEFTGLVYRSSLRVRSIVGVMFTGQVYVMNLLAPKWGRGDPWRQRKCSWNEEVESSLKVLEAMKMKWR